MDSDSPSSFDDSPSSFDNAPRAPQPGRNSDEFAEPAADNRRLRILVVDDLADAADSLARLLRAVGYEVHTAYDGPTAILAAERASPQLVLLDIGLPRMDGYQVARLLRQMPSMQSACLIALSGYGRDSDIEQAYLAGFDQHLLKPVSQERLVAVLREMMSRLA